jgi:hypothetical protein
MAADEVVLPIDEPVELEHAPYDPVIEPDHIEMMSAEMAHDEPASEELPFVPTEDAVPMADFTAAAEVLRQREDLTGSEA